MKKLKLLTIVALALVSTLSIANSFEIHCQEKEDVQAWGRNPSKILIKLTAQQETLKQTTSRLSEENEEVEYFSKLSERQELQGILINYKSQERKRIKMLLYISEKGIKKKLYSTSEPEHFVIKEFLDHIAQDHFGNCRQLP